MINRVRVTSGGRVTIPAELRKKYCIKPGTRIAFIPEGEGVRLQPINKEYIRSLAGADPRFNRGQKGKH